VFQNNKLKIFGGNRMKHRQSKIGKYGIKWKPVEGYIAKDGKKIPPHYKKVEFKWKKYN